MISLKNWGRWKPRTLSERAALEAASPTSGDTDSAAPLAPKTTVTLAARQRTLPRPALRWIAEGRIALRAFDFDADADAICTFQPETYSLNFPEFEYSASFASAFRHDLRRAALDPHNALFVLDDGREANSKHGNLAGFLWVVVCQNNWTGERFGYINNLFVLPHRRNQGLGRELMRQADEFFRSRGVKRVRLTVTASNPSAVALYENSGYHVQRWEMEKDL